VVDVVLSVQERLEEASLVTARLTQAMTIAGLDRIAQTVTRALPRAVSPKHDRVARLATRQADLVDRQYALLGKLFGLHREFAQRLFDVLGAQESKNPIAALTVAPANVISLHRARSLR
jgi:hypothetical protein